MKTSYTKVQYFGISVAAFGSQAPVIPEHWENWVDEPLTTWSKPSF